MVAPTTTADEHPVRVLLIDENPEFLSAATAFLQRQVGLVVLRAAADLEAALVGASDFQPDVIVLDPNMPRFGGLGVVRRLRTVLPEAKIVVLALIDSDTYRDASMAVGADVFVSKANVAAGLLPAIRLAAHRRTAVSMGGELRANASLIEGALAGEIRSY